MKRSKLFRISFLITILLILLFIYFYIHSRRQTAAKQAVTYRQEQEWQQRLEHARIKMFLQHYQEAEAELRYMLQKRPDSLEVKINLATILYYEKKYPEAFKILESIPVDKREGKTKLLMADLYLATQNYTQAEILYREHLQQFPNDTSSIIRLAELLSWQRKYDESLQLYQRVFVTQPDNIQWKRQYAQVLIWAGKYEDAIKILNKTLRKEPSSDNFQENSNTSALRHNEKG